MTAKADAVVDIDVSCDGCERKMKEGAPLFCQRCLDAAAENAPECREAHCEDHEPFDPPGIIRGYAHRGRILGTMKSETIAELEELADRIDQGEPVS